MEIIKCAHEVNSLLSVAANFDRRSAPSNVIFPESQSVPEVFHFSAGKSLKF